MSRFSEDIRSTPNLISLARLGFMGVGATLWFSGYLKLALACGVVAGITDYLDGIVARRTGQVTYLGAILDQFSDLVTEVICFMMIIHHPEGFHPALLFIYLLREFWVTTIRRFTAAHNIDIQSSIIGKLKTNFVGWGCVLWFALIIGPPDVLYWPITVLAYTGVYGGLGLAYISAAQYTRQFLAGYNQLEPG